MTLEECRRFYAEGIKIGANISSTALVEAFARVRRESFLPPGPWKIASIGSSPFTSSYVETPDAHPRHLYHNFVIAIDPARALNNGEPAALAKWIEGLDLRSGDRVYHLGCGVGYYTAIMAEVVGASGQVVASEVDAELAEQASKNLEAYPNVSVQSGDGLEVDPGPCDAIFVNAGVTHPHPRWLDSLREGGRLVLPLTASAPVVMGANLGSGVMAKITRVADSFSARVLSFVAIYSCIGLPDPAMEQALMNAMKAGKLFKMRSLRRDVHELTENCILHGPGICASGAEAGPQES